MRLTDLGPLPLTLIVSSLRIDLREQLRLDPIPSRVQLPVSGPSRSARGARGEGGGRGEGRGGGGGGVGAGVGAAGLGAGVIAGDAATNGRE